ncbi:EAL domain-containing protein [Breoghania sp.]|uniref:EAL domain-containing protein n=1 Tax=Breoghania sp. TaxID=2065378 RepID=UPI0029CA4A9F|nr:EAL domain-containing protein [Breoghania sp.]
MSRRYKIFFRVLFFAVLLAIVPLAVAKFSLDHYAESRARTELRAAAQRYVLRAEEALADGVTALQTLVADGHVSCLPNAHLAYGAVMRQHAFVQSIDVVDANGIPMCSSPVRPRSGDAILPAYRPDSPMVGLGLLDESFEGVHLAAVSWHVGNGVRLVAELSAPGVSIDAGPEYLRSWRRIEVRLAQDIRWITVGETIDDQTASAEVSGQEIVEYVRSQRYPLQATIVAPIAAASVLVGDLKVLAAVACGAFAVLFMVVSLWASWRPDQAADDEFISAIRRGEFVPYYQPVMDIETGGLRGCEVLIRWRMADGTIVSPGQFMQYAETSGHIFEMTRQIMRKTILEVGDLYQKNPDLKLSVNLFAGHFDDRRIIEDLQAIYGDSKIAFSQIVLEVTERFPLRDVKLARRIIAEMQSLGFRVALDDAGTGHGGLAYLQTLGIDIVKIDKMFVDTLGSDATGSSIVDMLVELAGNLGMGIIAEGVETMEQITHLRELGVTSAQGYIFAPPLPGPLFVQLAEALTAGEEVAPDADMADDVAVDDELALAANA